MASDILGDVYAIPIHDTLLDIRCQLQVASISLPSPEDLTTNNELQGHDETIVMSETSSTVVEKKLGAIYKCETVGCGKLFERSWNYKLHLETHEDDREYPFPCTVPGCSKKFVRRTDLLRHSSSVHTQAKESRCDFCGRIFATKDTLRR